jgi:beta-mannosidase
MHYWGVWWGKEPFSAYVKYTGRFVSEYGFQSIPAMASIRSFAPDSSLYLVSSILKAHNKHPVGFETIDEYMHRDYRVPADFHNYVFVSQLLQAEGMKTAIEAHRRAKPYCMGTLYWQLNDCWPVISWSSIDYYGRWKAFHYYLRKLYAPVLVSPVYENGKLDIYLISDYVDSKAIRLEAVLLNFSGKTLWKKDLHLEMKGNTSKPVLSESNFKDILAKYDKKKLLLNVKITEKNQVLAENNLFFTKVKDLILPHSQIQTNTFTENGKFGIRIISDVFIKNLFLDYPEDKGVFSDNYFDLLPGEVKTVWFNVKNPKKEIKKVKVKSLIERFNLPNLRK